MDWYAVATIDEALSIRRAGVEKPILLFGALQDPEIELAADQPHYHQFLFPGVQPATWRRFCSGCGKRMDCHIKIDTA